MVDKVKWRRVGLALADAALIAVSLWIAYYLRFDGAVFSQFRNQYFAVVAVFIAVRIGLFWLFGLYRGILRYASVGEMLAIIASVLIGSLVLFGANFLASKFISVDRFPGIGRYLPVDDNTRGFMRIPLGVLVMEFTFTLITIATVRFSRRVLIYQVLNIAEETGAQRPRRLLIVGAGDLAETAVRQIVSAPNRAWKPVAFVDDDPEKKSLRIHRVPVAGSLDDIPSVISRFSVEEVLVALRNLSPSRLREIVDMCEDARVRVQILPSVQDVMSGRVSLNQIRPVEIEDLLGREEVTLTLTDERNYIRDETILITGAGGSIGSELCRQLVRLGPKCIVLFGHGENSIYEISQELKRQGAGDVIIPVIGDIRDKGKLNAVVDRFQPRVFFHAAAHKHVPLMEADPDEAIKNNVRGTRNVAQAADRIGARKFIMISSDKAVRPTNVMGATKRVAEMIVFCMAQHSKTQYTAVRFGNVLGSRGSVVPLFRRQIAAGGPVTITHPDITRYFMTIPEAVSLVIQAGSMNHQRRLYLLDMGQPVKIVDLARNLIRLSGFEPEKEIEISYTGLRPGEKLREELVTRGENVKSTDIAKVFATEPEFVDETYLASECARLEEFADQQDAEGIREILRSLVPDYGPEATYETAEAAPARQSSFNVVEGVS